MMWKKPLCLIWIFLKKLVNLLNKLSKEMSKGKLFVEQRPQGDYAVRRPNSERASAVESTQKAAIERARQLDSNAIIHVERVRHTSGGNPDKWRNP